MVEKGLGITFAFGDTWNIDEDQLQFIPIYTREDQQVSRKVWMMLSEKCYKSEDVMDFDICRKILSCKLRAIPFWNGSSSLNKNFQLTN